ncbi:MAG: hypothetical protein H7145_03805 [Akkermansiaceae bacterium]|nr:hypothetical protein [Armatimonadota bacterium]
MPAADGRNSHFVQWTGEGDVVPSDQYTFAFLVIRGKIDTAMRVLRMEIVPNSREIFQYRSYGKFDGGVLGGQSDELYPNLTTIPLIKVESISASYRSMTFGLP